MKGSTRLWLMPAVQFEQNHDANNITLRFFIETVSDSLGVPIKLILSKTREKDIVIARQLIMYFCYNYTTMTYREIGKKIGKKDHSTVMHAVKTTMEMLEVDIIFRMKVSSISRKAEEKLRIPPRNNYYKASEITNITNRMANRISKEMNEIRRRDKDIMDVFSIDLESIYNIKSDSRKNIIKIDDDKVIFDKIFA